MKARRAWDAGRPSSLISNWRSNSTPIDADIRHEIEAIRTRCRDAAQNNDHARQFVRLVETNVVGSSGFSVQSRAPLASGRPDRLAIDAIEEAWHRQSERGQWDVSGTMTRAQFDRLVLRTMAIDGECLIRITTGWPRSDSAFAVQIIDAATLDETYNADLPGGGSIRMGIEMDEYRRPIAYHLTKAPSAVSRTYKVRERVRVPASEIIHLYLPEWIWQSRGIPWMAASLVRMQMLGGYEDAAITAARSAAIKSAAYVQSPDVPPGTGPAGDEDEITGALNQVLEPGLAEILPYGWDLKSLDWSWPNVEHGEFTKGCLRGIAAGLGVSYNMLATDLEGVNYSSLRQGALAERDLWMTLQDWYISAAVRPIFERWLMYSVGLGRITRPSGRPLDPARADSLRRATILGRRWPWVDPVKDLQAAELAIKLRTRSISDVIREQGRDPDDVWAELAADQERLRDMGLMTDTDTDTDTGAIPDVED